MGFKFVFLKEVQVYPVPPSLMLRRSLFILVPFSLVFGGSAVTRYMEWGVGVFEYVVGGGGRGVALLECLHKEVEPHSILPLRSLYADTVFWHPGYSYAAMGSAQQSDCNPTLDLSTRLRVGLLPLGGQATGYPFQGSRYLHPQQPFHRGDKGGEVLTLLEESLQIHLFLPLFRLVVELLWILQLVCEGVSVHDMHVVNTVVPLLPEFPDKNVSLLFPDLWCFWMLTGFV